jgi:hypothetical protein
MRISGLFVGALGAAVIASTLVVVTASSSSGADATVGEGIDCDRGGNYAISTATGRIAMPDGNTMFSWGYRTSRRSFQLPGPVLCVVAGDHVSITLTNTLNEDTSLVFPGQTNVMADGIPSLPQSTSGRVTSLAPVAGKNGGTITYEFDATRPGTFLYESGTDVDKQVQMGLYGAIIVYPKCQAGPNPCDQAYDDSRTAFEHNREFLHILSEVDPGLHLAVEKNQKIDWNSYSPKYFLLNGRSAPDTLAPNDAPWLPGQPYGSMVRVRPKGSGGDALPALVRYINVSPTDVAYHPHGNTERVVGEDASPLDSHTIVTDPGTGAVVSDTTNPDGSYGSFLVDIGASRTVDALFDWTDDEHYNPVDNPVPVPVGGFQDLIVKGTWWSMSPYLGYSGELPAGVANYNQCGEYYHVAHNHSLNKATNYGATFGGQMTLIRIDPPNGCPAQ